MPRIYFYSGPLGDGCRLCVPCFYRKTPYDEMATDEELLMKEIKIFCGELVIRVWFKSLYVDF